MGSWEETRANPAGQTLYRGFAAMQNRVLDSFYAISYGNIRAKGISRAFCLELPE